MRIYVLIALFLLTLLSCSRREDSHSDQNHNERFGISTELSHSHVTAFAEDGFGHVWIGTAYGLNKVFGNKYKHFFSSNDSTSLPSNLIANIFCDSQNRLWVASLSNDICLLTDKENFKHIAIDKSGISHPTFLETSNGRILLNTENSIYAFDEAKQRFVPVLTPKQSNIASFTYGQGRLAIVYPQRLELYRTSDFKRLITIPLPEGIVAAALLNHQELWLSAKGSMRIYNLKVGRFQPLPPAIEKGVTDGGLMVTHICGHDKIVMSTQRHGLFIYNRQTGTFLPATISNKRIDVGGYEVSCMFEDSKQNIWIGTRGEGFKIISNKKELFNTLDGLGAVEKKSVVGLTYDGRETMWIVAFGTELYRYHIKTQHLSLAKDLRTLNMGACRYIFCDSHGAIWLVMEQKLLKCHADGSLHIDQRFNFSPRTIVEDRRGTIWADGGSRARNILRLGAHGKNFIALPSRSQPNDIVTHILPLRNGHLLAVSPEGGLYEVDAYSHGRPVVVASAASLRKISASRHFYVETMLEDAAGNIWIGTKNDGIIHINRQTRQLRHLTELSCMEISDIAQDATGKIWVSTQYGLNKLSANGHHLSTYLHTDGISNNSFSPSASCQLPDSTIVLGTTRGVTAFNPLKSLEDDKVNIAFEYLKVNNDFVYPGEAACIDKTLPYMPEIKLRYDQNNFSISFTSLGNGVSPLIHHFQYKLEGLDKEWINAVDNSKAFFNNVPPGHYKFYVRILDGNSRKVLKEKFLKVTISPAPWNTWWARLCYLILIVGVLVWFYEKRKTAYLRRMNFLKLKNEREQEQRTNEINNKYFANVAHQLRTPLTMIAGPVELLATSDKIKGNDRTMLGIVNRSIGRMLRLVNQLMDFNKLETDALRLRVSFVDISQVLLHTIDIYRLNAQEKGIELDVENLDQNHFMYADTDKIENILDNLLSNAFKHTDRGGNITVSLKVVTGEKLNAQYLITPPSQAANYVEISVTDSGRGIPAAQLENIFRRYYQVDEQAHGTYNWGTGIGLYYARKLARLHHGDLIAANRADSHGAVFSLALPIEEEAYSREERGRQAEEEVQMTVVKTDSNEPTTTDADDPAAMTKPLIMVIDDDADVSYYLKTLLSTDYRVICRYDADNVEATMEEDMPSIVISDVVMGARSGFDLCHSLKENPLFCHIPVILLTAKGTPKDELEGLKTGADAYVTKPFHAEYLLALVRNILLNRKRIRRALTEATETDGVNSNDLSPQDKAFMDDLFNVMEKELPNADFNIAQCVSEMHVSHTKFISKVKALTGQTPSNLFRNYKLNRAAAMLKVGNLNISEVADLTGFSSLAHFSKVFKKKFGVAPSKYGKS